MVNVGVGSLFAVNQSVDRLSSTALAASKLAAKSELESTVTPFRSERFCCPAGMFIPNTRAVICWRPLDGTLKPAGCCMLITVSPAIPGMKVVLPTLRFAFMTIGPVIVPTSVFELSIPICNGEMPPRNGCTDDTFSVLGLSSRERTGHQRS